MNKINLSYLKSLKKLEEPISALTAYDATQARLFEEAEIEILLVGDSLGMLVKGEEDTLSVRLKEVLYHTQCVSRAVKKSYLIADLPFLSYTSLDSALKNSGKLIKEGRAKMVKVEGADENALKVIKGLLTHHIPVCGHVGLNPQFLLEMGKYEIKGKTLNEISQIKKEIKDLEKCGVPMVVLECIPKKVVREISKITSMITIGIGSGNECDGQILVNYDMLGMSEKKYSFSRNFLKEKSGILSAVEFYRQAVKNRSFPNEEESF